MRLCNFKVVAFFLMVVGMAGPATAGKYNEVLSIGDKAPDWKDLPGTDGNKHSLSDLKDKKVVVVVFTAATCLTAADYEDRLQSLSKKYAAAGSEAAVVAICVNRVKGDRLPDLTARAKEKKFVFTYLWDESQKSAKDYGAIFTPDFYVLDANRKVVYMGAMDDSTDPGNVKERYVEAAIQATLKGQKPAVAETAARGCLVRFARERRK